MDIYYTIQQTGSAQYKEKMSRFIAFALPVSDADSARELIKRYQNEYHDARHVCWAYMLGPQRTEWQLNDNGEPSGTAGKPILGQINSKELTNVLVIVVRYFGGIKLGTSGLIAAYREAARMALDEAGVKECRQTSRWLIEFSYETGDRVMKIIKHPDVTIHNKTFDNMCHAEIEMPLDLMQEITGRLEGVEGTMLTRLDEKSDNTQI